MFVGFNNQWPPPPPWEPKPPAPRLGKRDETVILWVVGVNLLLLFLAPIAGGSVILALLAMFG